MTSEIANCGNDKVPDRIQKPEGKLGEVEKKVLRWWCRSGGKVATFLDFASGNSRYLAVLHSDKMQRWVAYLASRGICLPTVAGKEELAARLTEIVRDKDSWANTIISASGEVAKLQGYHAKDDGGGVKIQIVLTEGLGG